MTWHDPIKRIENLNVAIDTFTKAMEKDGSNANLYFQRARLLTKKGKYEDALNDFENGIELCPACSEVWREIGDINMILGEYEKAASNYTMAINQNPNDESICHSLGEAKFLLGYYDQAIKNFKKAWRQSKQN